ncbi:MAG: TlpA family protein disulfide reductase [Clostridia bacterium]|nr:TlpA family protein disulfide reductase [Clostridia bacterium]
MKRKTIIALLLAFVLVFTGILVACNKECSEHVDEDQNAICDVCGAELQTNDDGGNSNDGGNSGNGGNSGTGNGSMVNYTINVANIAGRPIDKAMAFVYDATTQEMKAFFETDATGTCTKSIAQGNYYIELGSNNIPDGYVREAKYYFDNNRVANIVLNTEIKEGAHSGYKLGSVMKDFTVNTTLGETFKLSEALKTHDAVLLNLFYTTCDPCIKEFPYLNQAAGMYEDIAVIAVDTYGDTLADVQMFQNTYGIDQVDMGVHSIDLYSAFPTNGYPTSIMIDRYGVICLIEVGSLPYLYPWTQLFDYFSADDYTQKLFTSIDELTPQEKPNVSQPSSDDVAAVLNGAGLPSGVEYYPETEASDAEYYWPFVIGEKNGDACMVSSNPLKFNSVCAMNTDVYLEEGQALSLEYICSSELGGDYFFVLVNGEVIYSISGYDDVPVWKTLYPYVANEDGTYKITFIYNKDLDTDSGDDRVYIKNFSVVDESSIDAETYIPRNAVSEPNAYNTGYQNYATVVYNDEDGYYHVGTANGPILLANLMNYVLDDITDARTSLYLYAEANGLTIDGEDMLDEFVYFCSYASNSEIGGYCSVTQELKEILDELTARYPGGVRDRTENGWLRFCRYYDAYGTAEELADPIAGLAPFSAYKTIVNASVGLDEYPNSVYYQTIIMPRGKLFSFIPEQSGVYRILSNSSKEVDGWIFDIDSYYDRNALYTADHRERLSDTNCDGTYDTVEYGWNNVCMTYYFEAGKEYFIDVAFYDNTEVGTINFKVEYLGETYSMLRYASPAFFTFYVDPATGNPPIDPITGEEVYTTIAGGPTPVYNAAEDCYYIGDSKVYVDIARPIVTGFYKYSLQKAIEEGVFGSDTAKMQEYAANVIVSDGVAGSEASMLAGCIEVNAELAEILQAFVDRTSFNGIENAWTKLCYYFEYLGAEENE